jgi:hypothetical protein
MSPAAAGEELPARSSAVSSAAKYTDAGGGAEAPPAAGKAASTAQF